MESEWFILKKNEHLGPFTQAQLQQMFQAEQIDQQDQVWKEGWSEAKVYSDTLFTPELPELPALPPLPSLPDEDEPLPFSVAVKEVEVKPISEEAPKKKTREKHRTKTTKLKVSRPVQNEPTRTRKIKVVPKQKSFLPFDLEIKFKFEIPKSHRFVIAGVLLFLAGSFYAVQEIKSPTVAPRPAHMTVGSYKRISRAVVKSGKPIAKAALSDDRKTLWLGVNTPLMGEVQITLKSLHNKTIKGRASLKARGILKDRIIEVEDIQFEAGTRVVEGYYKAEIKSTDKMELPWWTRFAGKQVKHFNYQGEVLISSLSPRRFKKQLAKVLKKRRKNSQRFWEELVQKYQTVKMITGQIKDGFQVIFDTPKEQWKSKVPGFENMYQRKYGIFFTEFVKANEDSYKRIYKKKFENVNDVLASYNHLSKLATEIGEHSMFILEQLQKFKGDAAAAAKLKKDALAKIDSIISRCKAKADLLTKSLQ